MHVSDLPPESVHGIIRQLTGTWLPEASAVGAVGKWETRSSAFSKLAVFGKRLFHSSSLPAPQTRLASDTPGCCADVLGYIPPSRLRSCAWHQTDSETSSRSNTLPASARGNSPPARSASAFPVEYAPPRSSAPPPSPENPGW